MDNINSKDLERGYSSTGYIPEEGEDIFKDTEAEEMKMEKMHKKMGYMMMEDEEVTTGGFLERNNRDDRY